MIGLWEVVAGIFGVVLLVVWVITVSDIVRRRLGAGPTAAWLIIVLLLPFVGALLYWLMRKRSPEEIQRQADGERALRENAARAPFDRSGIGP